MNTKYSLKGQEIKISDGGAIFENEMIIRKTIANH